MLYANQFTLKLKKNILLTLKIKDPIFLPTNKTKYRE